MPFLFHFSHAIRDVPLPAKGSRIVSSTKEYRRIIRSANSKGNVAGCKASGGLLIFHIPLVNSLHSSRVSLDCSLIVFSTDRLPFFVKIRIFSKEESIILGVGGYGYDPNRGLLFGVLFLNLCQMISS